MNQPDWKSIASDLAAALEKLDSLYRSEHECEGVMTRPDWLRDPLQRYKDAENQPEWTPWDDSCEYCGAPAEILTAQEPGYALDGDPARCTDCGATGSICCDSESAAVIMWNDDEQEEQT